jgi:PAS domain S-box-containing protein
VLLIKYFISFIHKWTYHQYFILGGDLARSLKEIDAELLEKRLIIDNISDAVYTFDKDSIITSWNKSAEKLYGLKAAEIIGKNSEEFLRTESKPEDIKKNFSILVEKGEMFLEAVHYTKDNKRINIEAHVITLKDNMGKTTGYLTVNRDITKRKQAEEEQRKDKERLQILADLSGIFAKISYDYQEVLDYTTKILTDKMADICIIKLLSGDGKKFYNASLKHKDPEQH